MARKRTKQVQEMVDTVNACLKANRVIDEYHPDFACLQWLLLEIGCYMGFNWYYDKQLEEVSSSGIKKVVHSVLAGTADEEKLKELDAYIQLY